MFRPFCGWALLSILPTVVLGNTDPMIIGIWHLVAGQNQLIIDDQILRGTVHVRLQCCTCMDDFAVMLIGSARWNSLGYVRVRIEHFVDFAREDSSGYNQGSTSELVV